MTNILELKNIQKSYVTAVGELPVLKDVAMAISVGETVALVGRSGSGKSTFLHIAGLLDAPNGGDVLVNGASTKSLKDKELAAVRNGAFGFVYQQHHLLKEFTVLENVLMPARFAGQAASDARTRAIALLEKVGLEARLEHLPSQLSGGEQQRCALARALMNKPQLLLADEPTGNLDAQTAEEVTAMLFKLAKTEGLALLLVTHSQALAAKCGRQLMMRDGCLEEK